MNQVHPDIDNLVQKMRSTARRWILVRKPEPVVRTVLGHWLMTQTAQPVGGTGLLVTPSSEMMHWHRIGYEGPLLPSSFFMKEPYNPELPKCVSLAVDHLKEYPEKFLSKLDATLEGDADFALIAVWENAPQALADILRKHGFRVMNLGDET